MCDAYHVAKKVLTCQSCQH